MIRRTSRRLIVPPHSFGIGGNPSQRGTLYRCTHQNLFSRVNQINEIQRTWKEEIQHSFASNPDLMYAGISTGLLLATFFIFSVFFEPQGSEINQGMVNDTDKVIRNSEMMRIFEAHQPMIDDLRATSDEPEVFKAPQRYVNKKL